MIIIPMTCPHSYSTTCNNETYTSYIPLTHLVLNPRAPAMTPMQYPIPMPLLSTWVRPCCTLHVAPACTNNSFVLPYSMYVKHSAYIGFTVGFCTLWVLLFVPTSKRTLPSRFMWLLLRLSFAGHFDLPRMVLGEKDMRCKEFMPQCISFVHLFPRKLLYRRNGWWTRGW
jgi:hypothetical protein